jgi:hypothetical protein
MKRFECARTAGEILAQCTAAGFATKAKLYAAGSDHFMFEFIHADFNGWIICNGVTGRFWGKTAAGAKFDSDQDVLDGTAWFDALLDFVYIGRHETIALNSTVSA